LPHNTEGDTIILDDPLAAVDSHVAAALFYSLIVERLKDKAVLLITNQVQFLRDTDHIVVMDNGRIAEQGKYEELTPRGGKFTELVASSQGESSNDTHADEAAMDASGSDGASKKEHFIDLSEDAEKRLDASGNKTETMVRCAVSGRDLHSRMPLSFRPLLRLKLVHACDRWHSFRVFTLLTG
jgi:ABC-type multidrug transport system ATPase subunit